MRYSKKMQDFVRVVDSNDFVVLDTETTGLGDAEICHIVVINQDKNLLVDTLVRPRNGIPHEATAIHGISDEDVKDAPVWDDVWPDVHAALAGRNVIIYNADFDVAMLYSSTKHAGINRIDWSAVFDSFCAMKAFAPINGNWNDYHGSFTWVSLQRAVDCFGGHEISEFHSALADTHHTLFVARQIAKHVNEQEAISEAEAGTSE